MKTIPLTRGRHAIVDDEDYKYLMQWKWCCNASGYAVTSIRGDDGKQKTVRMHRLINKTPPGKFTDHIDGNRLNNRRSNLRSCTNRQNQFNSRPIRGGSSKYKGVCFHIHRRKWLTQIRGIESGKILFIGYFEDEEDAAIAYNVAAQLFYGEFAYLNDV